MRRLLHTISRRIRSTGGAGRVRGLGDLERRLGYRFLKRERLLEALTHRSTLGDLKPGDERITYERLEFLGDSVLSLVTSDFLFRSFPDENEGQLTKKKSLLVSKGVLAKKAEEIGIKQYIILSDSARRGGVAEQDSVLTAALEAIIGAIYLDGGMKNARIFVEEMLLDNIDDFLEHSDHINYKSIIQEWSQSKYRSYPRYSIKSTTGPEHDKIFLVEVKVGGKVVGKGRGKSKKDAEQMAAKEALHSARKYH
jgi:ribonuclease-3